MYIDLHKYTSLLPDFNEYWNFFNIHSKNAEISNFMKIHPVEAKLSNVDGQTVGQTDMTKLIVTVCNVVNIPKN